MNGPRDYHTESDKDKYHIIWYHLYVEPKKNDTNKLIYKQKIDSQTQRTNLWLPNGKGEGEGKIRIWGLTYYCNQQGPTVQHRDLYSTFYNNLNGK